MEINGTVVTPYGINIRVSPSLSSAKSGSALKAGSVVVGNDLSNGWIHVVSADGIQVDGWCLSVLKDGTQLISYTVDSTEDTGTPPPSGSVVEIISFDATLLDEDGNTWVQSWAKE